MKEKIKNLIMERAKSIMSESNIMSDEEEKIQNEYFRISKVEELESLNFIKNVVIPKVLVIYRTKHPLYVDVKFTTKNLIDALKKIIHVRFIGKRQRDRIIYSSEVGDLNFEYQIYKEDSLLCIFFSESNAEIFRYFYVQEGKNAIPMTESYLDPSTDGDIDKRFWVTKLEEQLALTVFIKKLLPLYINLYNESSSYWKKRGRGKDLPDKIELSELSDIIGSIKKVDQKIVNIASHHSRKVSYESKSSGGVVFKFTIEKSYPNVVSISVSDAWKLGSMSYEITPQGIENFNKKIQDVEKRFLTESTNSKLEPRKISKEEEIWARNKLCKIDTGFLGKSLKKIEHFRSNNPWLSDRIGFEGILSDGNRFIYRVRKNLEGTLVYFISDPDTKEDISTQRGIPFDYPETLEENKEYDTTPISKVEELQGLQFIKNILLPKRIEDWNELLEACQKIKMSGRARVEQLENYKQIHRGPEEEKMINGLTKIKKIVYPNSTWPGREPEELIVYKTVWDHPTITFLFVIRKFRGMVKSGWIDEWKELYVFDIQKNLNFNDYEVGKAIMVDIPIADKIFECISDCKTMTEGTEIKDVNEDPYFYISKLEEYDSLNQIKKKLIPIFVEKYNEYYASPKKCKPITAEEIIQSLHKIKQERWGNSLHLSYIVYGAKIEGVSKILEFHISKGFLDGQIRFSFHEPWDAFDVLVYYNNEDLDNEFKKLKRGERLTEATVDWQGWGGITSTEKEYLAVVLKQWQDYIKNIYSKTLASTMIYLVQKCIDNLDSTDPRLAARPLANLSMETRLSLMDYVDHADTTGMASKALDLLMNISRNHIDPPMPPKSDIKLKNITDIVYPNGKNRGDVTITGLEDMRPIINFGYGPYNLNDDFYNQFSRPGAELYLDYGRGVKIINMPEVMKKVKEAIKTFDGGLLKENDEVKKCVVSREDELMAISFIRRLVKTKFPFEEDTLKKVGTKPSMGEPELVSDRVVYTAQTTIYKEKVKIEIFNSIRRGGLHISIEWGNHRIDYRYDESINKFISLGCY